MSSLEESIQKIKKLNPVTRRKHRKKRIKKRLFMERNLLREVIGTLDPQPVRFINFIFVHKYIFEKGKIFKKCSIHKLPINN